jgi:hypothetical protein
MLRLCWKPPVAASVLAAAIATMAEGSPIKHFYPSIERTAGQANGLFLKTHGSHSACRNGVYGRSKDGWHRHIDGTAYRCAPPSTDAPQRFGPSSAGKGPRSGAPGQKTGTSPVFGPKPSGQKTAPTAIPKRK